MNIETFYSEIFSHYPIVTTDSRNITKDCLFFALKGDNFDGNKFALQSIVNGAKYAIVDDNNLKGIPNCILVDNVLQYLQQLSNYHRHQLSAIIIGITGTNGKTTTKELIAAVLSQKYTITYTKGNLNNHIGVPLTLLSLTKETEIGVIEMGANHPKEIEFLCNIAEPDYGIITNIGKAHLEGFGSFENVIATKTEMYEFIAKKNGAIFQDVDNPILTDNRKNVSNIISYAFNSDADYKGTLIENSFFACIEFRCKNEVIQINSQLFGDYNAKNMLTASSIGSNFKVSLQGIKIAIESYSPSNNRSQLVKTDNNTLILDAYNANPTSMRAAIEQFGKLHSPDNIVILGEMYELGIVATQEHTAIINLLIDLQIPKVILVGNWPQIEPTFTIFENSSILKDYLEKNKLQGKIILIKGSRGVKLETIVSVL